MQAAPAARIVSFDSSAPAAASLRGGGHSYPNALAAKAENPTLACDVHVFHGGRVNMAPTAFVDALPLSTCLNTVVYRYHVPSTHTNIPLQDVVRSYRHAGWERAFEGGVFRERFCEAVRCDDPVGCVDCVAELTVRSLPCAKAAPKKGTEEMEELIANNFKQKAWAASTAYEYRWSMGMFAGTDPVHDVAGIPENPILIPEQLWDQPSDFVADSLMIWVPDAAWGEGKDESMAVTPLHCAADAGGFSPHASDALVPAAEAGNGAWYLFYETVSLLSWNGDIAWACSRDGRVWRHGGISHDETFHLSFPTIFEWKGRYYTMPETHGNDTMALYVAEEFPAKWRLEKLYFVGTAALFGKTLVDHIILHVPPAKSSDGTDTVYLWSYPVETGTFLVYYMDASEFPLGTWTKHPMSPVTALAATGQEYTDSTRPPWTPRTCGPIIVHPVTNTRHRVAQWHGEKVYAWEITALSRTEYKERPASADASKEGEASTPVLFASRRNGDGSGWREGGMHTFDAHALNEEGTRWVAAVDGRKDKRGNPYK